MRRLFHRFLALYIHHITTHTHCTPLTMRQVMVTYEGRFPDGTVFDARLKTKQPFVFRKGGVRLVSRPVCPVRE